MSAVDLMGITAHEIAGAVAGAIIALGAFQPATIREFLARAFVAPPIGAIFAAPVAEYVLKWPPTPRNLLAVAALTGALAWPAAGYGWSLIKARQRRAMRDAEPPASE